MIVQLPAGGIVAPAAGFNRIPTSPAPIAPPPESCSVPGVPPAVQVLVVVALASVIAPGATGKTSEKDTPVRLIGLLPGFDRTIVNTDVPPDAIDEGLKLFVMVGGINTFKVPLAARPGGVLVTVIGPVVLVYAPLAAAVTLTSIWH